MRFIYYPIALCAVIVAVSASLDAARLTAAASTQLDLAGSTDLAWKGVLETLTFSWYSGATEARQGVEALFSEAARLERVGFATGFALAVLTAVQLMAIRYRRGGDVSACVRPSIAHMIAIAVIFLIGGVLAPVLSLRAYTDLPVLGTVVLRFESKSIVSTIGTLFSGGNVFAGVLVALFSVVIPAVKLALAGFVIQGWFPGGQTRALDLIKAIGKWSMADVFVVSVMLAFLATGNDEFSDARLGLGLYLFAGYCLLSQLGAHLMLRTQRVPDD